jgi:putative membrane protein
MQSSGWLDTSLAQEFSMTSKLLLSAAAALSLSACTTMTGDGATAQGSTAAGASSAAGDMTPEAALPYVAMAGASDLYEIQSSQLHHQRGENQQLHAFAQTMIDHHTQTTAATMAAARAAGLNPPPPQLLPMQREMIARLEGLNGAAFDREYASQQQTAHQMALELHQNYASEGDTPSLKGSAAAAVPIVQQHITQLRAIQL